MSHQPFSEIVAQLQNLCERRVTGTLFLSTEANRSAQLMLEQGEIIHVFYGGKRGDEALVLMSGIEAARARFQEGRITVRRTAIASTPLILERLARGVAELAGMGGMGAASGGKKNGGSVGENGNGGNHRLQPEHKELLASCLAECIGPMATIICEDCLRSADTLESAVELLAAETPPGEPAERFRQLVKARLAEHGLA